MIVSSGSLLLVVYALGLSASSPARWCVGWAVCGPRGSMLAGGVAALRVLPVRVADKGRWDRAMGVWRRAEGTRGGDGIEQSSPLRLGLEGCSWALEVGSVGPGGVAARLTSLSLSLIF